MLRRLAFPAILLVAWAVWMLLRWGPGWEEPVETGPVVTDAPVVTVIPDVGPVRDLEAIECQLDVERWDSGDRAEVERKYGQNAEAVVEGCRAAIRPAP